MNKALFFFIALNLSYLILAGKFKDKEKPEWAKKDIRDYTDADMERLLEQWEEDEDPLEEDELPEHLRLPPKLDMSKIDMSDPEGFLQASKKGRTLMTFVNVAGNPTKEETEQITKLWQTSLWNNHIQVERYLVGDDRAIFLFKDGSHAFEAKEFLIGQERCESITIESKVYHGKYSKNKGSDEL